MPTFRRNFLLILPLALFSATLLLPAGADAEPKPADESEQAAKAKVEATDLGETRNVHQHGPTLLCGQPDKAALATAKEKGIEVVITLRKEDEIDWNEEEYVTDLGMDFHQLGFQQPDSLSDDILDKSRMLLRNTEDKPVMLHCASANRVGAVWMAYRVLDHGVELATALEEAQKVGLRTPAYAEKVVDYIHRKQSGASE
ncbi:MAG: hypothetical protein CMJ46_13320 [Planctomyces sp.]|nr:hypothetical protein [Planctomyces sp.]